MPAYASHTRTLLVLSIPNVIPVHCLSATYSLPMPYTHCLQPLQLERTWVLDPHDDTPALAPMTQPHAADTAPMSTSPAPGPSHMHCAAQAAVAPPPVSDPQAARYVRVPAGPPPMQPDEGEQEPLEPTYLQLYLLKYVCPEPGCFGTLAPPQPGTDVLQCSVCNAVRSEADFMADLVS